MPLEIANSQLPVSRSFDLIKNGLLQHEVSATVSN